MDWGHVVLALLLVLVLVARGLRRKHRVRLNITYEREDSTDASRKVHQEGDDP